MKKIFVLLLLTSIFFAQNVEAGIFCGWWRDRLNECRAEKDETVDKYNECRKHYNELSASVENMCKWVTGTVLVIGVLVIYKINAMNNKLKKLKRGLATGS